MGKRFKKLCKLTGDVPRFYNPHTIYTIGILLNMLVDDVNYLGEEVERLNDLRRMYDKNGNS